MQKSEELNTTKTIKIQINSVINTAFNKITKKPKRSKQTNKNEIDY